MIKFKPKTYHFVFIVAFIVFLLFTLKIMLSKKSSFSVQSENYLITPPPETDISWDKAVDLIQECQIKTIFQKKNLEVTLTSKNNQIYKTSEPKFNDVIYQANHLRSDCLDVIQKITE